MDKSDMILAQMPIVLSLILLVYQAYKAFEIKDLRFVFYGFFANLLYLISYFVFLLFDLNEDSILGSTQIKTILFYTSMIDVFSMLFFSIAAINNLAKVKVKRIYVLLFYTLLLVSAAFRIIPDNPINDKVPYIHMRYIPYSIMAFFSILMLARMFYKITKDKNGSKLLVYGTCLWAMIQFIGIAEFDKFQKPFSGDRLEQIAFGLGFISKAIILFGLFEYIITIVTENANKKEIASKLDLIFGVSFHEFTHPLRGIKTVLREVNPEDESKASSYIGFYKKSVERIDEHYNHLLAIISASIKMYISDTGKPIVNDFYESNISNELIVTESINTTIQVVVLSQKASTSRAESEKINFEFNFGGNCIVSYNPNQMFQVFQNLFKNSKEAFRAQNGKITVKTRVSQLKSNKGNDDQKRVVIIEISDDGPGIDISIANRVFNAGISTKSSIGRGLGLAIAKRLIEENSGTIELKIPENLATGIIPAHFIITLPKATTKNLNN